MKQSSYRLLARARGLAIVLAAAAASACHRWTGGSSESRPSHLFAADPLALALSITPLVADSSASLTLQLDLPAVHDSVIEFQLPDEWAGRRELYRNIVQLETRTPGASLELMTDPSRVRAHVLPGRPLTLTWRLGRTLPSYSAADAHNHSDIGADVAQLVGYDALILPLVDRATPVRATFVFHGLPHGVPINSSFGPPLVPGDTTITASATIGDLQHAVYTFGIRVGAARARIVPVRGGRLTVSIRGRLAIPDSVLVSTVTKVVKAERDFWGGLPPANYFVTIGVAPRGTLAGTRLTQAFVADVDSTRTLDPGVVALFGHELMHEWLGSGLLHPASTVRDGQLAWFFEGFTDYLARRVELSAALISDSAYLAAINRVLLEHAVSSARDMPWDTVVTTFWRDPAAQREPYLRGELLALRLNAAVSRATGGNATLDSELRELPNRASSYSGGFTDSAIVANLSSHLDRSLLRAEVNRILSGRQISLPDNAFGQCATARAESRTLWDPGFDVDSSLKAKRVVGVRSGGPADQAGARDGMRITGTSIWRGDPTKQLLLVVRADTAEQRISYLPASGSAVPVQHWSLATGGRNRLLGPECRP